MANHDFAGYTVHIRPEAPLEETLNALQKFVEAPFTFTVNSEGKIILWSSTAYNCGYLLLKK